MINYSISDIKTHIGLLEDLHKWILSIGYIGQHRLSGILGSIL